MGLNSAVGFKAILYSTSFTFSRFSSVRWYVGYHWPHLLDKKLRVELEFLYAVLIFKFLVCLVVSYYEVYF